MLLCAVAVVPVVLAARASSVTMAVLLIGLAAAAHQGWSANIFTLVSDMFPKRAVGSVVGFGGMFGAIGGMVISKFVGIYPGVDGILCSDLYYGRFCISDCPSGDPHTSPANEACDGGIRTMSEYAIVVDPHDNVAVAKKEVPLGTTVMLDGGRSVSVKATVTIGNRFATGAIPAGGFVCQYGQPIGTSSESLKES